MRPEILCMLTVLGVIGLSMIVYRVTPSGRGHDDRTGRGGSFVLGFWVRNWFYWFIRPVVVGAIAVGLSPFVFNVLAVVLGAAAGGCFATGHFASAGWMVLLSGFADVIDGEIARGTNVADARGAFIDSTFDRFSEFFAFVGMTVFYQAGVGPLLVVVALGGSLLVSYTRARGESVGILCKFGVMQRAERMLLVGLASIFDGAIAAASGWPEGRVLLIVVGIIAAGTVATAFYRTAWISRRLGG